ncbi:transmembrane protein 132C [Tenrec ecaudatus]|uniref:transmembrane protein 132C n=1 Tax=Tenrec ecaudatus TaxID=94439 RepID=UPI003F5AD32F
MAQCPNYKYKLSAAPTSASVIGALISTMIEGRGVPDNVQRFSSLPPYLPASYRILSVDSFFLKETSPRTVRNASLQTRVESFFAYKAQRALALNVSYGPFSVEKAVPLDLLLPAHLLSPTSKSTFHGKLKSHILQDRVYPSRPRVQVLFQVMGRDWNTQDPPEPLPCLRVFAFRETREVRGSCQLRGPLGLCVAQLELLPAWFSAPTVVAGRKKVAERPEGTPVELYYSIQPGDAHGDCIGRDSRKDNAIRPGKDGLGGGTSHLQRIGTVGLYRTQDSTQLSELRLDSNVAIWLPSRPVKQGDVVTAYVTIASDSTVDLFILRAKVKKGVNILSTQTGEPRQWDSTQEMGNGSKHSTATVVCQRLGPRPHNRSGRVFVEVVRMNFEMASFSSLSGSQPITWQVEYPRRGATDAITSEIFVSQKDLAGIVPLAMDTEILNTAILTGKTVTLPTKVVSVEENGAVADISELVECKAPDEDVIKVSDHCNYVFVNGKEMKGRVDVAVNFTYQHLSAPLHITVWVPRLPLQIEVSDTELNQIKGWRVPIVAGKRPTRDSEDEDEEGRRGRGCALQYQHATVRVLTQFVAEGPSPWGRQSHLLSPDWQLDVSHLVAEFIKLEEPGVATLEGSQVLVGREVGMTTIQVLSPLSDSILAEKTVTVLDEKVTVTDLAVQLVAGLSVSLQRSPEDGQVFTAMATAEEQLRAPKQEAVVSTWLRFNDGSMAPLDIYDPADFSLAAASLDEAVVSVPQGRSPRWPTVVAEGEGQGPLVRVDLTIAEACQKFKRRSVLAVGVGSLEVKFGPGEAEPSPGGDPEDEVTDNHASDRRHKGQDRLLPVGGGSVGREGGALRKAGTTARTLPDEAGRAGRRGEGHVPGEGQLQNIPLDFTNFPGQVDAPQAGAGLEESGLVAPARSLSDLEVGMYALLGVFCLAILVFLINCATFALRFRHKQLPLEGQAPVAHSHDWVWLGNQAELLEAGGGLSLPPSQHPAPSEEHTTVLDRRLGGREEESNLLLNGAPQRQGPPRGREEPLHSPAARRKRVRFSTFATLPLDEGCPTVNSILGGNEEDIPWVCREAPGGRDPRVPLGRLTENA